MSQLDADSSRHHHHFNKYATVVYHQHPAYYHDNSEPVHLYIDGLSEYDHDTGRHFDVSRCTIIDCPWRLIDAQGAASPKPCSTT